MFRGLGLGPGSTKFAETPLDSSFLRLPLIPEQLDLGLWMLHGMPRSLCQSLFFLEPSVGFPKLEGGGRGGGVPLCWAPESRIRAIVCWGLYWGPIFIGNYHFRRRFQTAVGMTYWSHTKCKMSNMILIETRVQERVRRVCK